MTYRTYPTEDQRRKLMEAITRLCIRPETNEGTVDVPWQQLEWAPTGRLTGRTDRWRGVQ